MTIPDAPPTRDWWTRPIIVLPAIGIVALIVALLTPQSASGRMGDSRLSSHLAGALGARLLSETAHRLGWRVIQRDSQPAPLVADGHIIHAVLAPPAPITRSEAHGYLEAVRGGDALLLVLDQRTPLSDSLGVSQLARDGILPPPRAVGTCVRHSGLAPPLWVDGRVHLLGVRWLRGEPANLTVFSALQRDDRGTAHPGDAAVGFAYGRGRIVVVGDPDLLRTDVLRHCPWGAAVIAIRLLEYLRAGGPEPRSTLAFDEYHQGFGAHPGIPDVASAFLFEHPIGRTILVAVFAALVWLAAAAVRPFVPAASEGVERRDPLEHVDALAHAYEQVHASRTVTVRLLRGMRWRVERGTGAWRSRPDDAFLDAAATRAPALASDVSLVRRALRDSIPDRELPELGAALRRIEHTLTMTAV